MAFPGSPDDGDVYGRYVWDNTNEIWQEFPIASQAEAEAGVVDNVGMTPERVAQHNAADTEIGLNTTHRSSDGSDHSKVGTNETAIGLNTTHRGSVGTDHSDVGLNTTHRSSDGSDHSKVGTNETAIGLNTTHRSSDGTNHSNVVLNSGLREWDSTVTYAEDDFTFVAGALYRSLQDANLNKDPTTETDWWEEFTSGGGGSFDVVTGIYNTGWISNSDWTNAELLITHNLGKDLAELIVDFSISSDGTNANARKIDTITVTFDQAVPSAIQADRGTTFFQVSTDAFKIQTGSGGVAYINDAGAYATIIGGTEYYRVRVYDPNKIAQAEFAQKYSTGWVANSDWTDMTLTVTHGLNAPMSDLITKFFFSTDGTEENAREVSVFDRRWSTQDNAIFGWTWFAVDDNSLVFQTGAQGISWVGDDVGGGDVLDSESYYYKVVVYKPTVIESIIETTMYDTGWITNGTWQSIDISATHNLGANLSSLIVKFFISTDGTDANSAEFHTLLYDNTPDSTGRYGFTLHQTDTNTVRFRGGANGLLWINATGTFAQIDNTGGYANYAYRIVIYKPEMIAEASNPSVVAETGDFTVAVAREQTFAWTVGGSDQTATLPPLANGVPGDIVRVCKVDSGAGEGQIDADGSEVIDGVAIAIPLLFDQYNYLDVRHMGSFWTIVDLKSNGSNSNGKFMLRADGSAEANFSKAWTPGWSGSSPRYYYNATGSLPYSFVSTPTLIASCVDGSISQRAAWLTYGIASGVAAFSLYFASHTNNIASLTAYGLVLGRWRT